MNNGRQTSANQGPRDVTMARGYPPRDASARSANASEGADAMTAVSAYLDRVNEAGRNYQAWRERVFGPQGSASRPTGEANSTGHDLRAFIVQQLATLKQDFRRELEDMKKAIQDDMYTTLDNESGESEARLKAELKKLRGSIIDEVRNAIEANAACMDEELPNKIEELLSARFDEVLDKIEEQAPKMKEVTRKVDAIKDQLEEDSGYMRECGDVLLDATKASLASQEKLAALLKKFEAGAAGQVAGAPQAAVEASAALSSHQAIQQDAATTSTSQQNQIIPISNATATTIPGGPASFTLSATASSISFSMNEAGSLPANGTTPTASLAQLRKTRQIIHDNNDVASGSAMPPAKRPRTEEVPKDQGGSRGSSSASETLTGDDEDKEGAGQ